MTRRRDRYTTNVADEAASTKHDAAAKWLRDHEPPKWRKELRKPQGFRNPTETADFSKTPRRVLIIVLDWRHAIFHHSPQRDS